ncbi:hypothetical protein AU198_15200 [Mycobacterium sp. GA-1199]|nr:hypothetical protein AU198_15200 [Mycobacterium sp. GA-1199]
MVSFDIFGVAARLTADHRVRDGGLQLVQRAPADAARCTDRNPHTHRLHVPVAEPTQHPYPRNTQALPSVVEGAAR